ncbi:ECF RNA polymerase sigma factor SigK [Curtobacterium sp. Csp1]|uniref:ECF RNA polymerase sigma factor SigK n=1 Tax=Curtobacterium citreum TaxID=2036 RepID=A0ABT2HG70_9MICO|nr:MULTISPECIES: ECF RNA polymerase sigma factor SigK [Curtobacterium]MCS6522269.1 ECF RNA polymerase sigma factor SigK [Curtobacterium citreum]QKS13133.1 ECF RNA polymerase sigma factor SigK [Curtobacterium sp. csp3]QKS19356.1 ECF RNA polymerase sigma factor SigK [Curtobacterium sp. Csp1]RDI01307.1 RNA polymerase ECF family sigma subunit [Curtobacterium sp. AG1037]TQJ29396.1 RNA polymerase ECF family sigma subunit [Curtobacterium citreum]
MLALVERDTEAWSSAEPAPASPDDMLARVADGDQAAFSELYDALSGRVLGLVTRLLRDRAQSEEVTQEIFLEVWQQAARFDRSRGTAASWVLTMAHRRAVDRVRASQSSHDRDTKIGIRDLESGYDQVSESVEIRIEHERVSRALGKLTEFQRQAVQLAYYGGYSHSEMAERLGVPIGTVKTRLRDGMIRLRDEMGVTS